MIPNSKRNNTGAVSAISTAAVPELSASVRRRAGKRRWNMHLLPGLPTACAYQMRTAAWALKMSELPSGENGSIGV